MIDVSRFHVGDACPRCVGRRVFAVSAERNEWLCTDNARPFPMQEHALYHDAAEWDDYTPAERQENAENMMKLLKTQRPSGAGDVG